MKHSSCYEDIIDLPHPVSQLHPQMSIQSRAAQFAPFAALSRYEDEIQRTAEKAELRMEPDQEYFDIP